MKTITTSLPVLFLSLLCLSLAVVVYALWGSFVTSMVDMHTSLHSMLTRHTDAIANNTAPFGIGLIVVSFLYGAFHAIGPGHGKAVIVTYLGTHRDSLRSGIVISLIAAVLQSIVAIALVSTLAVVLKFNFHQVQQYSNNIAYVSYGLIVFLGLILLATSIRRLAKPFSSKKHIHHDHTESHRHSHDHAHADGHNHKHHNHSTEYSHDHVEAHTHHSHAENHAHDHGHDHSHSHESTHNHSHHHAHDHGSSCGCTHAHVPEKDQSLWKTMTVILSMGLRPCTGAIVVLVYAHLVGVYSYGIAATLMMGIGTGLSVSLIAIAAQHARSWLEKFAESSSSTSILSSAQFSNYVKFIGGVFLVALGWSLYIAASTSTAHYHLP